jgi:hypothetical protein
MNSWPQLGSALDLRAGLCAVVDVAPVDQMRMAVAGDLGSFPIPRTNSQAGGDKTDEHQSTR